MKTFQITLTLCLVALAASWCRAEIYIGGHADLGVGFEDGQLHLHLHAEDALMLYGGGSAAACEYEPGELMIGVPDPAIARPAGSAWNFLAANPGDPIWFLPQSSTSGKPFLGLGTEELTPAAGWTSPLTWRFNSILTISGDSSQFAVWQNDSFGNPQVFASTLLPTAEGNSWTQNPFSHDHFNLGFTGEGIYDVSFSIEGVNSGVGSIPAGTYRDTASFRFVTGQAIAAVPEPSGLAVVSLAGLLLVRRRQRSCQSRRD